MTLITRCAAPKCARRRVRLRQGRRGHERRIALPRNVVEVPSEQAELPELVSDILRRVRRDTVRFDQNLGVVVAVVLGAVGGHHPAAGELAGLGEDDRAGLAQQLERLPPEAEADDVRLPGEQVVGDVEPAHGGEVRVDDPPGDVLDEHRRLVAALLDLAQHGASPLEQLGIGLVPRGHRDVHPRAVLIERFVRLRFDAELANADHDVGDLDAGVVDVVVHLDGVAGAPEHTGDRVSDARVAQMADVRRLVGVGGGVLDERLAGGRGRALGSSSRAGRLEIGRRGEHRLRPGAVVEVGVDVPRRGHRPGVAPGAPAPPRGAPPARRRSPPGARRRTRARPSGAGVDQSPNSGRAERSTTTSNAASTPRASRARRTASTSSVRVSGISRKGNGEHGRVPTGDNAPPWTRDHA